MTACQYGALDSYMYEVLGRRKSIKNLGSGASQASWTQDGQRTIAAAWHRGDVRSAPPYIGEAILAEYSRQARQITATLWTQRLL